jgi:hypothetical protein
MLKKKKREKSTKPMRKQAKKLKDKQNSIKDKIIIIIFKCLTTMK